MTPGVPYSRDYVAIANQYASDVLSGAVPACRWVRLACQRQVDDLARLGFAWHFDPAKAARVCKFIELLPHIKGRWKTPYLQLEPWQIFILCVVFGWVDEEGNRRYRTVYIEVPRKNGKSALTSGVALYCLCEDEPGAEVYSAATKKDQAKIVWDVARRMVNKSPGLKRRFGVETAAGAITVEDRAAAFKPLSSDEDGLDGLNIHFVCVDELHAHKTRAVWDVLDSATGSRRQPIVWAITTAGFNRAGICYEQRGYVVRILEGGLEDDRYFGIIYTLDLPSNVILQSLPALQELEQLCNCNVRPIQIEKFWREACARHVTTAGIDLRGPNAANSTPTDRLKPEECAGVATHNGNSAEIQATKSVSRNAKRNGRQLTPQQFPQQIADGETDLEVGVKFSTSIDSLPTESPEINTTPSIPNSKASAQYAKEFQRSYAWITATTAELFGGCSADDVTLQSVFSETLRNVYDAHSPTCAARKAQFLEDGRLSVTRPGDDPFTAAAWQKANPNYGVSVMPADIAALAKKAKASAQSQNGFLTKRLDCWVNANTAWMSMPAWDKCADSSLKLEQFERQRCILGLDLASKLDIAAKVYLFRRVDGHYVCFTKCYLPQSVVDEGLNTNAAHYAGWAKDGWLTLTEGSAIDHDLIEREIREDAGRFEVTSIPHDNHNAQQLSGHLLAEGLNVLECRTTADNMSEAMKTVEAVVIAGRFHHDGNPAMTWMMSNVVAHADAKDRIFPNKETFLNKIDGPVALFAAVHDSLAITPIEPGQIIVL